MNKSNTIAIFINQLREKVGVIYGNPETTTGGRALKFYASVSLDIRRIEAIKNGSEIIGNRTRVKVVKNKVAPPFKEAEFDILYGQGISKREISLTSRLPLILSRRAVRGFPTMASGLGRGATMVRKYMIENPDFTADIEAQIREKLNVAQTERIDGEDVTPLGKPPKK